ncbi:ThuA domain-containing protein [Maribacter sp. MAR_2009_72]|uniref:ThuA domain-containing protein n=1 Tax=Maribacter sp. MAR_2009_72 TaxID=1250050 RepID=UPI00119C33AC|nr:ThuA domain-containing protein [Maribacter sp. MAR_2009_72]TVZ17102.1 trehalose utilization protein [Maribacter sp. MAR_2009_72]
MKTTRILALLFCLLIGHSFLFAQSLEPIKITDNWLAQLEEHIPSPTVKPTNKRKVLVFSKATGFDHWTIPHNIEMLKLFGKKTDAFEIHVGFDIDNFDKKNLKKYDAVVLNNSNPTGPKRDLFYDLLKNYTSLSEEDIVYKAKTYEQNLMDYVKKGGGLMILHGAIVVQNNSKEFSDMTGGSFDYHPKQQQMHIKEVDSKHPLVKAFKGNGLIHVDEPYFFKNSYFNYNFRPLLYFEVDTIEDVKHEPSNNINYVAWIKRYGKGRVFYSSPSHNAQSLEHPELLQFLMDGLQYVTGDLKADDSPMQRPN